MSDAIHVLDWLATKVPPNHTFGGGMRNRNYDFKPIRPVQLRDPNGQVVQIEASAEVVVYRSPRRGHTGREAVATIWSGGAQINMGGGGHMNVRRPSTI